MTGRKFLRSLLETIAIFCAAIAGYSIIFFGMATAILRRPPSEVAAAMWMAWNNIASADLALQILLLVASVVFYLLLVFAALIALPCLIITLLEDFRQ